jgi:peptide/nickel transport system ATP-binding protein
MDTRLRQVSIGVEMPEDILVAKDLKKHFVIGRHGVVRGRPITVKAVDGISFGIHRGETFGLVGESGSGKSTVAYMVAGMYQPTAGTLRFNGRDLATAGRKRPLDLKKEIQIVFQDPGSSLHPLQTIRQILELPLRIHQHHKRDDLIEEVARLLYLVELPPEYLYKYPHMLSGGEKQIIAIARALASNPSFIILDEPTSALDVSVQGKVINLLIRLQREFGLTYLFITHDLSLMRNVATRVAIMYLGKIAEVAETATFFENSQHPYTQMLLSSIPVVSEEEVAAKPKRVFSKGEIPSPVDLPQGCSFHTRCAYVVDICKQIDPEMIATGSAHNVRCHLYRQGNEANQQGLAMINAVDSLTSQL